MRPKVVALIILVPVGILLVAVLVLRVFFNEPPAKPPVGTRATPVPAAAATAAPSSNNNLLTTMPAAAVVPARTGTDANDPEHTIRVQERIIELTNLAMNNDANSLNKIWMELSNSDKEIRAGALDAVVQFGDRSAAPRLRALAAQTEDPTEKASMIAAADYLELPTPDEIKMPARPRTSGSSTVPGNTAPNNTPRRRTSVFQQQN